MCLSCVERKVLFTYSWSWIWEKTSDGYILWSGWFLLDRICSTQFCTYMNCLFLKLNKIPLLLCDSLLQTVGRRGTPRKLWKRQKLSSVALDSYQPCPRVTETVNSYWGRGVSRRLAHLPADFWSPTQAGSGFSAVQVHLCHSSFYSFSPVLWNWSSPMLQWLPGSLN